MANRKLEGTNEITEQVAVVKKYANRRLYNTASSSYVTLEELCQMVRDGKDFVVFDAKSGEDITRSVLTQIILEEDSKGRNLLPIKFLRQLIGFYDDSLHAFLPRYLELSMENFARHQDQMRGYMEDTFGRFFPLNQFEDMARQNMALLQRAANMFSPFPADSTQGSAERSTRAAASGTATRLRARQRGAGAARPDGSAAEAAERSRAPRRAEDQIVAAGRPTVSRPSRFRRPRRSRHPRARRGRAGPPRCHPPSRPAAAAPERSQRREGGAGRASARWSDRAVGSSVGRSSSGSIVITAGS